MKKQDEDKEPYVYKPDARLNWDRKPEQPPNPPKRQDNRIMDREAVKDQVTKGKDITSEQFSKS